MTTLTIAVLTYQRDRDLAAILPLLAEHASEVTTDIRYIDVLVVDNDPVGGAHSHVQSFGSSSAARSIEVRYVNETHPGISAARNRALAECGASDLLVFIDDDERPTPGWLTNLLAARERFDATAVVGPVISEFERQPEPWIVAGRFFQRRRLATGTRIDVAATNNLLLDMSFVRRHNLEFDLAFGLTGGDDTMFTRQLRASGGTMVWCDEAIVTDVVPRARSTRRWVVLRAFSSGNSWALTGVKLAKTKRTAALVRARVTVEGIIRIGVGLARITIGCATLDQGHRARGVRTLARGAGMAAGSWGFGYREYARPTRATARR
ncbi:glycosyltransferase family 2 protein [Marisediminicola sp. LYQ134]|uniref:glycosyltransferase family 2 protein n=1 Tax=Marisediminicola sp. LYQ134 TaxID=3391061 RepID=UPI0039831F0D